MTIDDLQKHLLRLLADGIDPNTPMKFRNEKGKHEEIDYSVKSNDGKSMLLAEEWF